MPASPRPRRLHLLGSNARIYIAQECTTRGSRRLHLHVQEHNSRYARPKDARVYFLLRASKKMPTSTSSRARPRRCPRLLLLARVQEDARVSLPACVQEMPASTSMRAKMHASPATCAPKMAAFEAVTGITTGLAASVLPATFSPTMRSNV